MKLKAYNLRVKDMLADFNEFDSGEQTIYYKESSKSNKKLFRVRIYLEGRDLPYVKKVKYTLHKTFGKNRVKIIKRSSNNTNCSLFIWTWGIFTVNVEIEDIKGRVMKMDHYLTFGNQLNESNILIRDINLK